MSSQLAALCFDARDPLGLARFWAVALGWEIGGAGGADGGVELVPTDGTRFPLRFQPAPEPTSPKVGQNRIHLDLVTTSIDDQAETVERLVAAGGSHIDIGQGPDELHVVLADPEGNELCVIEPDNSFLAGCDRLGAINCDGTQHVGYFWSTVLAWPLVWDQDEETAIRDPDGTGPFVTWGGPPVAPKPARNRLHLDIAPSPSVDGAADQAAEVERLVSLGAMLVGRGDGDRVEMTDPDGNEFCVLGPQ